MTFFGTFPQVRLRRNRQEPWCRALVAEHKISTHDLIWPLFVREAGVSPDIPSMPGIKRYTVDELMDACVQATTFGIPAIALFPVIAQEKRAEDAAEILNPEGVLIQAIQKVKENFPHLGVITDVALDAFTSHGQDGLIAGGKILNDETLLLVEKAAVLQGHAGSDVIAPSEMMDGRVQVIRQALDREHLSSVKILSYTAKYASAFYGPFRDALGSLHCLGKADKKTYQMDPANSLEALREGMLDVAEGADMLMIKPGLPYLDVIYRFKQTFHLPLFAYHVSGEYAMLKAAAAQGYLDYEACLMESLIAFKRAGVDGVFTYAALDAARLLCQGR